MKPLVSILIPAFNAQKWIRDCISSALVQSWCPKEIIVVDDGSQDDTFRIVKSYASSIVNVITQQNSGASSARNRALSKAQGDYIQWLDADDILVPDKISKQMEGAEHGINSRILLSSAWGRFYERPETAIFKADYLWENLEPKEWLFRKIDNNLWMAIESWLVSRKLTEMAGPWNEKLSLDDDGEYFCRVLSNASEIKFICESRSLCRRDNLGLSHNFNLNNQKLDSQMLSILSYINTMRRMEESERTRNACLKLLNRFAIYVYPERLDIFNRMQLTAIQLGGELKHPELRPKYRLIQKLFGWRLAKKAQYKFPALLSMVRKKLNRLS